MSPPVYSQDGIYRSPRPPISLPQNPNLSMIAFFFRKLSSISKATALIDAETGQALTFHELKNQVSNLSQAILIKLNLTKNDVVLIFSPNSIYFPISFLAVVAIGAIATTVNPLYTINELSNQVKDSNPKLVITVSELYHKVKHFNLPCILLGPKGDPLHDQTTVSPNSSIWYWPDLMNSLSNVESDSSLAWPSVMENDVAALLYSSGTTGKSKGVILTHRNFIATALMVASDQDFYGDQKNVFLCFLPMFHIFGLSVVTYAQLQRGNTVVVMKKFELDKALSAIQKYRVTHMYVAPPVLVALVKQKEVVKKYDVSSLKEIGSGAAPLRKDVMEDCAKIFPKAVVFQGYGMTETCGMISIEDTRRGSRHSGSSGMLVPGVESRIIDIATKKPLPPFQKGEILVRGTNMMQGYFNNQRATEQTIDKDGWVYTGDLGYFDEERQIYVVDRIKELIKCKGFRVAPAELEELLITHPGVSDAAVIPSPDAESGEVPIAYVVRSPGSSVTEEEVQKFIAEQVAPYKRLRKVIFTGSIPKSASGKILRRELIKQRVLSKL